MNDLRQQRILVNVDGLPIPRWLATTIIGVGASMLVFSGFLVASMFFVVLELKDMRAYTADLPGIRLQVESIAVDQGQILKFRDALRMGGEQISYEEQEGRQSASGQEAGLLPVDARIDARLR